MSIQFRTLVNRVMEESDYNSKTARDEIVRLSRIKANSELLDELLHLGADQLIRNYHTDQRRASDDAVEEQRYEPRDTPETPEKEKRRKNSAERRLLWDRYALFGHKPLKVADKADLKESEGKRRAQAAGNIRCADFEAEIGKDLPRGKKVGDFFAIAKIVEIAKRHNVIPSARD